MKGAFFSKPLEWSIETKDESWQQGGLIVGTLRVKNHGTEAADLNGSGAAIAYADIKKVHSRAEGAFKIEARALFNKATLAAGEGLDLPFSLPLPPNGAITDKKGSFYLIYGKDCQENNLQLKVEPKILFGKLIGLLDTFYRFKLKEFKAAKNGVEYKLIPPTARDMANLESLSLIFSTQDDLLNLDFEFLVKKLETSGVTNKIAKSSIKIQKSLTPKEYSLGRDMINQDVLLKVFEGVIAEVKLKSVF